MDFVQEMVVLVPAGQAVKWETLTYYNTSNRTARITIDVEVKEEDFTEEFDDEPEDE